MHVEEILIEETFPKKKKNKKSVLLIYSIAMPLAHQLEQKQRYAIYHLLLIQFFKAQLDANIISS